MFFSRAIYDGHEHQKFMEKLDERVKSHDKDIERMCNHHYQGFIDSIRELLQVRSQAQQLNVSFSLCDSITRISSDVIERMFDRRRFWNWINELVRRYRE